MVNINSRQAIETLKAVHDRLDGVNDAEKRRVLKEIIFVFQTRDILRKPLRQTVQARFPYIPPGL